MSRWLSILACLACAATLSAGCGDGMTMVPPDTTPHVYDADDPNILCTGRIDFTNAKQPKFSVAGTSATVRFMGTGAWVRIKDEYRYGKFANFYDARVDDAPAVKIEMTGDPTAFEYEIATDLPYGAHTLTVVKRTEPNVGIGYFAGFTFAGTILPPPARPAHKLEFIGDSITAGAGVDAANGSADCMANDNYGLPAMDADKAYGADAARALDAEYHVVGVGGIGLIRNYTSNPANDLRPMPEVYDLLFPEQPSGANNVWDTTAFVPDAVVVALGTNDFSPGDNPGLTDVGVPADARPIMQVSDFVTAYVAFVDTLRSTYPNAHVFVISSPMLGDGWPSALYMSATDQKTALTMVESHYAAAGDDKVHKFFVDRVSGTGCGTHPNAEQQADNGQMLADFVKTTMQW